MCTLLSTAIEFLDMSLNVDVPPPPSLDPVESDESYHRVDLGEFLEAGAWESAFTTWAEHTTLTESEFAVVVDLEMIQQFDFFWDDFVSRVGYHAPGLPEDWRERELHPALDSWETASTINASLAELGSRTSTILTEEYVDWDTDSAVGEDLPDFE